MISGRKEARTLFANYFTYWDDLPAGSGSPTFGKIHIAWLVCIALAIVVCTLCFLRLKKTGQNRFLKILAIVLLAMEAYREIVLIATGAWEFEVAPLHLCGLAIFIEVLYVFFPDNFFGEISCVLCLPGAASALLFPDWLRYPTINYINLHGFILHAILCLLPILLLASGTYRPKIRRVWMPIVFLVGSAVILYPLNVRMGTNFMFLNYPSVGSPFEAVYKACGYGVYLTVFVAVVIGVVLMMYAGIAIVRSAKRRSSGAGPGG